MKDFMCRVVAKLLSVRLWVTILVIATLCTAVLKCFDLIQLAVKNTDEKLISFIEKIIMFILGSFTAVVSSIVTLYFTRTDRSTNGNTEEEK
jgi:hypothetical protein